MEKNEMAHKNKLLVVLTLISVQALLKLTHYSEIQSTQTTFIWNVYLLQVHKMTLELNITKHSPFVTKHCVTSNTTQTHTHIHTRTHTHTHTHTHTVSHTQTYTHARVSVRVCSLLLCTSVWACVYCVCVYCVLCLGMAVCVCVRVRACLRVNV